MQITIATRLRPFSHTPGISFLLPGSSLRFQIFPAKIFVHDLSVDEARLVKEIDMPLEGPVDGFTALQDLEKGFLLVWGWTPKGFVRYRIERQDANEKEFAIIYEKHTQDIAKTDFSGYRISDVERLSLGNHKAQDWDLIQRRKSMVEIFPLWMRLGKITPKTTNDATESLLNQCQKAISTRDRKAIIPLFRQLYMAGFDVGLSPRKEDQHQGFKLPVCHHPLALLSEGSDQIRKLFVQSDQNLIEILPVLPPEFHSGRIIQVECEGLGTVDLEWSKHLIRRMVFTACCDREISFRFQKEIQRFRLRENAKDRGKIMTAGEVVAVKAGQKYYFDNFEK